MNRSSAQPGNLEDDQEGISGDIRSDAGVSSQNREENKFQQVRTEPAQPQGLYLSLSTAQAYSIMRNIPPQYRLLEKTYLKKCITRKKARVDNSSRHQRKSNITTKPRSKRQRGDTKTKGEYISSEYIDQLAYMAPPENTDEAASQQFRGGGRGSRGTMATEPTRPSSDHSKNKASYGPPETLDEEKFTLNKGASRNGYGQFEANGEKNHHDSLPVSDMKIKLEPVVEDESPKGKEVEILDPPKHIGSSHIPSHSPVENAIPIPDNTANLNTMKLSPVPQQPRLKAEEEHFSEWDDTFSTQGILLAYTKKSERLFNCLNEVVNNHSWASIKQRVDLIRRLITRLGQRERESFLNQISELYNIDLNYFDIWVNTAQPDNTVPKMSLACLSPYILEWMYNQLDMKNLASQISLISREQPSFPLNQMVEDQVRKNSYLPSGKRQERGDRRYQQSMSSRPRDYSGHPSYPQNMMRNSQNHQYGRNGYNHSSRDNHQNGNQGRYAAPEYPDSRGKYSGMNGNGNGNPNQLSISLNRENSSSFNHNSHHMSNSNHSPALDLAKSQSDQFLEGHDFGMQGMPSEREHSSVRNNLHG